MITEKEWGQFNAAMNIAFESFANKTITWRRSPFKINEFMEDEEPEQFNDVELNVLCNYNYMRTWPINQMTETGALDAQSIQVYIPLVHFAANDLNTDGMPIINHADLFIVDGMTYHYMGDTPVSQAQNGKDLFFAMVLKRYRKETAIPILGD